jgi:hypothetical protein
MSIEPGVSGTPVGPPWSVDDVADVQAGLYPAEVTADLRARIAADPDGAAILAALDSTVDDLSLLPPLVIPPQYALRIDQAISAEVRARAEGRTTPVVTGGFGALLNPSAPAAPQPGLPTLTATQTGVPGQRSRPPRMEPGAPPPRHPPLIPRVLPGAAQHQPPRAPHPDRPAGGPPPYAPTNRGQAAQSWSGPSSSASSPSGSASSGGPGSGPGRSSGSTGRGPGGDRPGTVSSLDAARAKRRRWTGGLLAAAAVAAVVTFGIIGLRGSDDEPGGLAQAPATVSSTTTVPAGAGSTPGEIQAFAIEPGKFDEAFAKLNGTSEGKLTDPPVYTACLAANKITGTDVLGVSDVTYEGKPAMAIAVAIPGNTTQAKVLVVGTGCGPNGPELLAEETVTR